MKELNLENAPAYAAGRRDSKERRKVLYRVRPRFEAGCVLDTRTETQDMSDPAEVADVLRETAADAETLRDTLNDWIDGQYGIAENENGELESLREIVGNMSIVMSNAAHVLEKCAAGAAPYETNAAECLEVIEGACNGNDSILCAVRDARKALGLPNESGAGMVGTVPTDAELARCRDLYGDD